MWDPVHAARRQHLVPHGMWNSDLFLKLAVISPASYRTQWCGNDHYALNLLRALMYNEQFHEGILGVWQQDAEDSRRVNVSVTDVCNQELAVDAMSGVQVVLLLLPMQDMPTRYYSLTHLLTHSPTHSLTHLVTMS